MRREKLTQEDPTASAESSASSAAPSESAAGAALLRAVPPLFATHETVVAAAAASMFVEIKVQLNDLYNEAVVPAPATPTVAAAAAAPAAPAAGSTSSGPSTTVPANSTAAAPQGEDGFGTALILVLTVSLVALLGTYCWWRNSRRGGLEARGSMRESRRSYRREVSNTLAGDGKTESEGGAGTEGDVPSPGRKSYRDRRSARPASGKVFGSDKSGET